MMTTPPVQKPFDVLKRFARRRGPEERCELCGAAIAHEHEHVIEIANRKLLCSCQACAICSAARRARATGGFRKPSVCSMDL